MMREERKRRAWTAFAAAAIAATLAIAGCGGGSPVTSALDLTSPGVNPDGTTKPHVHCGWGPVWVPLEWRGVPEGTKELAIYIARFTHKEVDGRQKVVILFADLLSNIKPSMRKLPANVLPDGAGWSNVGSTTCPPHLGGERVIVQVFALDRAQRPREMKRSLATRLAEEALANPKPEEGPRSPGKLTEDAAAVGRLILDYPGPHIFE